MFEWPGSRSHHNSAVQSNSKRSIDKACISNGQGWGVYCEESFEDSRLGGKVYVDGTADAMMSHQHFRRVAIGGKAGGKFGTRIHSPGAGAISANGLAWPGDPGGSLTRQFGGLRAWQGSGKLGIRRKNSYHRHGRTRRTERLREIRGAGPFGVNSSACPNLPT